MLADSAKIQEEDAAHLNIARNTPSRGCSRSTRASDVKSVLDQVVAVEYDRFRDVAPGVRFKFLEAGHILGSAMVHI